MKDFRTRAQAHSSGATIEEAEIAKIFTGFAVEAQKRMEEEVYKSKKKVLILAGPTAVGKSALAIELAKVIGGEIVSADAMQIYRDMDIGTAKPTLEEREAVPHHLIDIRDLSEGFNVVDFYNEARQACQEILARDAVPIVVGGSGFYLHALIYGPPSGPPSVPKIRRALEEEMELFGVEALFERLRSLDPKYASTITKNDRQKICRGLEIIALTGNPVSRLSWKGRKKPLHFDFRAWFLYRPKEHLFPRIEERCERMLEEGFLAEVEKLEKRGLRDNSSASQAIGYRQALDYLSSPRSEKDFATFLENFKKASIKYAKRQFTWFKGESLFRSLDFELHDPEIAIEILRRDYETSE